MASIEQLSAALINADKAGDADAARALAAEITRMRSQPSASQPEPVQSAPALQAQPAPAPVAADPRDNFMGKTDALVRGAADTLSFGTADELAAHVRSNPFVVPSMPDDYYNSGIFAGKYNPLGTVAKALASPFASDTKGADYDRALAEERGTDASDSKDRMAQRLAGQILGGIGGGVGLAKSGLSATANAVKAGKGLGGVTKASAIEGSMLGGLQGFGSGEGIEDRLRGATVGAGIGFGLGGALPAATTAVAGAFKGAAAPFVAPWRPAQYTDKAMATYLQRSGKTPEQIASIMRSAGEDGQGMYSMADAMGNAGQRALVPVTRTPNDARQDVTDFLVRRQMGQPQRLANALAEGFDAPNTAEQVEQGLTGARNMQARVNYDASRQGAGPVNVQPIVDHIDETLQPGVNQIVNPGNNIAYDDIEAALAKVKNRVTDGRSNLTDYNALFRVKLNLDDAITKAEAQGAGNKVFALRQVKQRVDSALEDASPAFRNANDTYHQQSQVIDSIGAGSAAKSGRVRSADSIDQFNAMQPDQQQAFRVGYVDPIIADIESSPMGPATNRARALTTPKYEQEFQAFAAPGRAEQLGNRIGRENRMFETNNAALGNSRTADNLGDIDDMANFDPAVLTNLLTGNWKQAALTGVRQAFNAGKGMPPRVVERVGRNLIETNPDAALSTLNRVNGQRVSRDQLRAMILSSMLQGTGAGLGRLP